MTPDIKPKYVTISQLVKASKKNGFEWGHGNGVNIGEPNGIYSCVVGQGIRNLGGDTFPTSFDELDEDEELSAILHDIYNYNDDAAKSYEEAFNYMRIRLIGHGRKRIPIGWL